MLRRLCSLSPGSGRVLTTDARKLSSKLWHELHPRSFHGLTCSLCCCAAHLRSSREADTFPGNGENSFPTVGTGLHHNETVSGPSPVTPEPHTEAVVPERSRRQKAYENASRKGFLGTYDEWGVHVVGHFRTLGGPCFRSDIADQYKKRQLIMISRPPYDVVLGEGPRIGPILSFSLNTRPASWRRRQRSYNESSAT